MEEGDVDAAPIRYAACRLTGIRPIENLMCQLDSTSFHLADGHPPYKESRNQPLESKLSRACFVLLCTSDCTQKNTKKVQKNFLKPLAYSRKILYNDSCCDMIATKREVAAARQVFRGANVKLGNWRQVTVQE